MSANWRRLHYNGFLTIFNGASICYFLAHNQINQRARLDSAPGRATIDRSIQTWPGASDRRALDSPGKSARPSDWLQQRFKPIGGRRCEKRCQIVRRLRRRRSIWPDQPGWRGRDSIKSGRDSAPTRPIDGLALARARSTVGQSVVNWSYAGPGCGRTGPIDY